MKHIKPFLSLFILPFIAISMASGQNYKLITKGISADPSFYDGCKISENEFWIGGENGVLFKMDTMGILQKIEYGTPYKSSVLRIVEKNDNIFIGTNSGTIFQFNQKKNEINSWQTSKTNHLSFYDIVVLNDSSLLICGGKSKIAKGRITIPRGFIMLVSDLPEKFHYTKTWKKLNSYVWAFLEIPEKNEIYASAYCFPGNRSILLKSTDRGQSWNKINTTKGLVHQIVYDGTDIWYSGSKNIFYNKDGIIGKFNSPDKRIIVSGSGCIYDLDFSTGQMIGCDFKGRLVFIEPDNEVRVSSFFNGFPLYDLIPKTNGGLLMVGHGSAIFQME